MSNINSVTDIPNEIEKIDYVRNLNRKMIKKIDTSDMYQLLTDYGKLIKDAINRSTSIKNFEHKKIRNIKRSPTKNIIVLGIGGSAMAGELIKSYLKYLKSSHKTEITVIRGTELPNDIKKESFVFCCSYSGNTVETLDALEKIKKITNNIVAITSGGKLKEIAEKEGYVLLNVPSGMMPRCAMFYSFFYLLNAMFRFNVIENDEKNNIKATIKEITSFNFCKSLDYSTIDNNNIAIILARFCEKKIPIIYTGAERLAAVNLRWKAQIQENANNLCFGNYFPELNHNEMNSWMYPSDLIEKFIIIAMKDIDDSDESNLAITNGLELLRDNIHIVEVVVAGKTLLERIVRLICLADWFSFYLAIINKTDPTTIPLIEKLKEKK